MTNKETRTPIKVGTLTAATLLELFLHRKMELDEELFDECTGRLICLLEDTNDEKWRLKTNG